MKKIEVERLPINTRAMLVKPAESMPGFTLVQESCTVMEGGVPRIVYMELDGRLPELRALREALPKIKYVKDYRTGGLPTTSRIFGYSPRVTLRKDFCSASSLVKEMPAEHLAITEAGKIASIVYRDQNRPLYDEHMDISAKNVRSEWRIAGTPFTSGIINLNNQLLYHLDSGNFKGVWSAMLVFKKDVSGGHLSVPEYGLEFMLRDASLLLFDGQSIAHGVTPIRKESPYGYRYSVVYYSLRQMWNCLSVREEVTRIRTLRAQRERRRVSK